MTYAEWQAQVDETRSKGFSVDAGYHMEGVTFIAAPVFDSSGRLTYSVVVSGKSRVLQKQGAAPLERAILDAAHTLTRQI